MASNCELMSVAKSPTASTQKLSDVSPTYVDAFSRYRSYNLSPMSSPPTSPPVSPSALSSRSRRSETSRGHQFTETNNYLNETASVFSNSSRKSAIKLYQESPNELARNRSSNCQVGGESNLNVESKTKAEDLREVMSVTSASSKQSKKSQSSTNGHPIMSSPSISHSKTGLLSSDSRCQADLNDSMSVSLNNSMQRNQAQLERQPSTDRYSVKNGLTGMDEAISISSQSNRQSVQKKILKARSFGIPPKPAKLTRHAKPSMNSELNENVSVYSNSVMSPLSVQSSPGRLTSRLKNLWKSASLDAEYDSFEIGRLTPDSSMNKLSPKCKRQSSQKSTSSAHSPDGSNRVKSQVRSQDCNSPRQGSKTKNKITVDMSSVEVIRSPSQSSHLQSKETSSSKSTVLGNNTSASRSRAKKSLSSPKKSSSLLSPLKVLKSRSRSTEYDDDSAASGGFNARTFSSSYDRVADYSLNSQDDDNSQTSLDQLIKDLDTFLRYADLRHVSSLSSVSCSVNTETGASPGGVLVENSMTNLKGESNGAESKRECLEILRKSQEDPQKFHEMVVQASQSFSSKSSLSSSKCSFGGDQEVLVERDLNYLKSDSEASEAFGEYVSLICGCKKEEPQKIQDLLTQFSHSFPPPYSFERDEELLDFVEKFVNNLGMIIVSEIVKEMQAKKIDTVEEMLKLVSREFTDLFSYKELAKVMKKLLDEPERNSLLDSMDTDDSSILRSYSSSIRGLL